MSRSAFANLFRSRRFWVWEIGGLIIYAIPVTIRLATGHVILPVLSLLETPWIGYYIPGNLVEKLLVNAFFPGGAGAVAGEIYFSTAQGKTIDRRSRYLARLSGALLQTGIWSLFQLTGGLLNIAGSWGGNLFEYPTVFPLNFLLASLSIFTPSVIYFLKNKIVCTYSKSKAKRD